MIGHRALSVVAAGISVAVVASVVALTVLRPTGAEIPPKPSTSSARVVRTDLSNTATAEGTLGYAPAPPIVNELSGTYTALTTPGTVIQPGQALYSIDDRQVVLMAGTVPAWRPFAFGMADGPDVGELTANLIAMGDAAGLLETPSDHFDRAAVAAVRRWQLADNLPDTGEIPLGEVVFRPASMRVGSANTNLGAPARPGDLPYALTTTTPVVTVAVGATLPPVHAGDHVTIQLPNLRRIGGLVFALAPQAAPAATQNGVGNPQDGSSDSPAGMVATVVAVRAADLNGAAANAVEVSFTTQIVNHVLAVPISALLGLAGGGYGVEVIEPHDVRRLTAVSTGLFTGTQVEISGRGLHAGTKVVIAQ
jgi:hypothetical protein